MKIIAVLLAAVAVASAMNPISLEDFQSSKYELYRKMLVTAKSDAKLDEPEITICNDVTNDYITNINVNVTPFPIVLQSFAQITLSVLLDLLKEVPVGARVKLELAKEGSIVDIPVPCLDLPDVEIPLGSCEYDADQLLALGAPTLCPTYFPDGQECKLPLAPGTYGDGPALVIDLPELPDGGIILPLLEGIVRAKVHVSSADGTEIGCIQVRVELVK